VIHTFRALSRYGRVAVELGTGLRTHFIRPETPRTTLARRVREQWRLLASNGMTAPEYYLYGLDRPDLPWERKREFLGELDRWRWAQTFNPVFYRFFTENKLIFKRYLAGVGIPVAPLLGVICREGLAETGQPLRNDADVTVWLNEARIENATLKPVLGARGTGVLTLGRRVSDLPAWERVPDGRISLSEVVAHVRAFPHRPEFLVEARLRPHPALSCFSPHVLHTARVVTALEGEVVIIAAVLRIAAGHAPVDNFSQGNLAAPIELDTGRLGPAVHSKKQAQVRLSRHPVTGAEIEGRVVPDWTRACEVLRKAAGSIPFNRLLGWDVAFTPEGPVVIEANDLWDLDLVQIPPDRGLLGTRLHGYLARSGALDLFGLGWS
jgi:hypothetical protein